MAHDTLETSPGRPLSGCVRVPGDKSISHRALIISGLAGGTARITGLLDAGDVRSTEACMRSLGAAIRREGEATVVTGTGGRLSEPEDVLDCGNSGTTMRLLCGLLAPQPLYAVLTGDASLRGRPMGRVTRPLGALGAQLDGRAGGSRPPLTVRGGPLSLGAVRSPVASAQVKSALVLAALGGRGTLRFSEPALSRDHTERMLAHLGVALRREATGGGPGVLVVPGGQVPAARDLQIPGDLSSAAFLLVAAAATPGSDLLLEGVGVNPTRTGVLDALEAMGADLRIESPRLISGEPVAALRVRGGRLRGARLEGALIPRLIDELPALAVAAAVAEGETVIADAAELRVKESDRIAAMAAGLEAMGARVEERPDGLCIRGSGGRPLAGGATVHAGGDHRIAMAFAVAGLLSEGGCRVRGASVIGTSFPSFPRMLERVTGSHE